MPPVSQNWKNFDGIEVYAKKCLLCASGPGKGTTPARDNPPVVATGLDARSDVTKTSSSTAFVEFTSLFHQVIVLLLQGALTLLIQGCVHLFTKLFSEPTRDDQTSSFRTVLGKMNSLCDKRYGFLKLAHRCDLDAIIASASPKPITNVTISLKT